MTGPWGKTGTLQLRSRRGPVPVTEEPGPYDLPPLLHVPVDDDPTPGGPWPPRALPDRVVTPEATRS